MCAICDGATEDEVRERLAECIEWYGWAVQGVEEGPRNWGWAHTVGLAERFGHPELVVAGAVSADGHRALLNLLGEQIQLGRRFGPGERAAVAGVEVRFGAVHPAQLRRTFAMWFDHYPDPPAEVELTALQVLLPSRYFCDHLPQPRLDRAGDVLGRRSGNRAARRARDRATTPRRRPPPARP